MSAFSIETVEDVVIITAPSAHRPAHLLIGVPLVLWLVATLPNISIWIRACVELYRTMGPLTGALVALPMALLGALFMLAPGLAGVFLIAYEFAGVERVTVSARGLRIKREVRGIGLPRRYRAHKVRNPRLAPVDGLRGWWAPSLGGLLFDYGRSTRGFGAALTSAEAERVLEVLAERLPEPEPEEEATGEAEE